VFHDPWHIASAERRVDLLRDVDIAVRHGIPLGGRVSLGQIPSVIRPRADLLAKPDPAVTSADFQGFQAPEISVTVIH
jgi:hypothetical protein